MMMVLISFVAYLGSHESDRKQKQCDHAYCSVHSKDADIFLEYDMALQRYGAHMIIQLGEGEN